MFPSTKKPLLAVLIALPFLLAAWMWQLAQKRPHLIGVLGAPAQSLALSRDASLLAVQRSDGSLQLWQRGGNGSKQLRIEGRGIINPSIAAVSPIDLQFSPDDQTLLGSGIPSGNSAWKYGVPGSGNNTSSLYAWNTKTRAIAWSLSSNLKNDQGRFWPSADGKRVVSRSFDFVKVFDTSVPGAPQTGISKFARTFATVGRFRARISLPKGKWTHAEKLAVLPGNTQVVLAEPNGQLEFWNIASGQQTLRTPVPPNSSGMTGAISALSPSPDGRFVALRDSYRLFLWDTKSGSWTQCPNLSSVPHDDIAWMPDSRSLWVGGDSVQQFSAPSLTVVRKFPVSGPIALSGDGRTLATRTLNNIGVWTWNIG